MKHKQIIKDRCKICYHGNSCPFYNKIFKSKKLRIAAKPVSKEMFVPYRLDELTCVFFINLEIAKHDKIMRRTLKKSFE